MMEVLSIFKQSDATIFRSIQLLDQYLKCEEEAQKVKDLHLIGVCTMFISTKLHELHPIKMRQMVNDISKGKFTTEMIMDKELQILKAIGFRAHRPTIHCFAAALFTISGIEKKFKGSIEKYGVLLQKMFCFSYDIVNVYSPFQLALFSAIISLKLFQQSHRKFPSQKIIYHLIKQAEMPKGDLLGSLNYLRDFATNFKKNFPFNRLKSSNSKSL